MKRSKSTAGKCGFCGKDFDKSAMAGHLTACEKRNDLTKRDSAKKIKTYLIMAEGRYSPEYWIFIEADSAAKLKHLDDFLRKIWLECCGHLSAFEINRMRYNVISDEELQGKTMNISLDKVLKAGSVFYHEYDFGSTTYLSLKVIYEQPGVSIGKKIKLLARNNPPESLCAVCGQPAEQICTECFWSDKEALFCNKCAESHQCDSGMFLPVVNSPRVGVCGYTG